MTGRGRGRPPGGPVKKRKAESELSTNPHSKRTRARTEGLSEERRAYEKARKNFDQQWKRLKDKLHQRADFKDADPATQQSLEEAAFEEHSDKYKSLGRHPDQLLPAESSQSTSQANEVMEDDDDPEWETDDDLDEDEEKELEHRSWRLKVHFSSRGLDVKVSTTRGKRI